MQTRAEERSQGTIQKGGPKSRFDDIYITKKYFLEIFFYSRYFLPTSWILLKQLFLSPEWTLSQQPIRPSASWAIDSESIRARGIIVKYLPLSLVTVPEFFAKVSFSFPKRGIGDMVALCK